MDVKHVNNEQPVTGYLKILALALVYYVTGRLGLLLAIPPGFATIAWPASGIALAVILLFGYRFWLGVFLGSFVLNVFIAFDISTGLAIIKSTAVAGSIAAGASLQAVAGAWLVRKYIDLPTTLEQAREIGLLIMLGGPVGCLVNSVVACSTLYIAGVIHQQDYLFSWFTWWVGDTIGVIVFAPLVYILLSPKKGISKHRKFTVALPLSVLFSLAVIMFVYVKNIEEQSLQSEFTKIAEEKSLRLRKYVQYTQELLHSIQVLYATSDFVNRSQFQEFVRYAIKNKHGIQAIGWVPKVTQEEKERYKQQAWNDGIKDFAFLELNAGGDIAYEVERETYYPVYYIEPYKGNERVLGFDLGSNKIRLEALEKARDTGRQVSTLPVFLVQEKEQQYGFLIVDPIYKKNEPMNTLKERRQNLIGYISSAFRINDFVKSALSDIDEYYTLTIIDTGIDQSPQTIFGDKSSAASIISLSDELIVGNREWLLRFTPTEKFLKRNLGWQVWSVLTAGLLIAGLSGAFLLVVTARTEIIQRAIHKKTDEINKAQAQLKLILNSVSDGIYGLDLNGKTTFINKAAERMVGYTMEEMVGVVQHDLVHHSYADGSRYPEKECKIYNALISGNTCIEDEEVFWRKDGSFFPVEYTSAPIIKREGYLDGAVVVFKDITMRKQSEEKHKELLSQLAHSNEELERFAYVASHDLKAPLRSIDTLSTWIEEGLADKLAGENKDNMHALRQRVSRMNRLLDDLLEYSRLSHSQELRNNEVIDGDTLMKDISLLLPLPSKFTLIVSGNLNEIEVNRLPIQQVIYNLLGNAIKHHDRDDGNIRLNVDIGSEYYEFTVSDDGPGIAKEYQEQIFEMFQTLKPRDKVEGSGMGLTYVKKAIESHGGIISVNSMLGKGATFTFTWPRLIMEKVDEYSKVS